MGCSGSSTKTKDSKSQNDPNKIPVKPKEDSAAPAVQQETTAQASGVEKNAGASANEDDAVKAEESWTNEDHLARAATASANLSSANAPVPTLKREVSDDNSTEAPSGVTTIATSPKEGDPEALSAEVQYMLENLWKEREVVVHADKLNDYSILGRVPAARKLKFVGIAKQFESLDRAMGSMCGMGIGDAMGHMFEFLPAQDTPGQSRFVLKDMRFYGEHNTFGLEKGQWTDDAAMGLCIADSLILQKEYDGGDMRARFWCWWNRGYNNAFRLDKSRRRPQSVGLGGNISKSLSAMTRLKKGQKPPAIFEARGEDAGNGSLMRFTPIAIFFHAATSEELYEFSRQSSYTTHPGIVAAEACSLLAHLIHGALHRPPGPVDPKRFIEESTAEYLRTSGLDKKSGWGYNEMKWLTTGQPERATERCWKWREKSLDIAGTLKARGREYNGYPVSAGYFGSYSLDGLAMAIWAVYHSKSFNEAIEKSINLLGDADSHGSIAGQIAGALYGYSTIHPQFLKWQNKWDEHEFAVRAVLLNQLGSEWASADKR